VLGKEAKEVEEKEGIQTAGERLPVLIQSLVLKVRR